MIFTLSEPPRDSMNHKFLEIKHKIVVDDCDMFIMPMREIESYFPAVQPGFKRASIIQGHHNEDAQTLFLVTDHEKLIEV